MYILQSGYQLLIHVRSPGEYDGIFLLIDQVSVEIPASALGQYSPPQNYLGSYHEDPPVILNFSYSLGCSPSYSLCTSGTAYECVLACEGINSKSHTMCAWNL